MIVKGQVIDQDFAPKGGLNTTPDPFGPKENETPDSMDIVFFDDSTIGKRYGRKMLNPTVTGVTDFCNGLFDYGVSPGVRKLIGAFGSSIYKMDDLDGTFDSLSSTRSDCLNYFERSKTRLIICNEAHDVVKYWDGITATLTDLNTTAPYAKIPISFQGFLFLLSTATSPRAVYYEDENTITTGLWNLSFDLPSSNDDEITGAVEYNGRFYISLKTNWYQVSYVGGQELFSYKRISSVIGAVGRTIKVISLSNIGEVIIYLGWNKRIYIFDGSSSYPISMNFEKNNGECPVYLDGINQGGINRSHATVDTNKNVYKVYVPVGADGTISHCFNVNLENLSCYVSQNQKYLSSCMAEDSSGKRFHVSGGYNGEAYIIDEQVFDELPMNNVAIGADAATVTSRTYVNQAGGFTGGTHNAGDDRAYAEDSAKNFVTLGVLVGDTVVDKTDGCRGVVTSIANGAGTNARLNAIFSGGTENNCDNGDVFTVYKDAFININESIYIGSKLKFDTIIVELLTPGSVTIAPSILYSADAAGTYTALASSSTVDGTAGFTRTGIIRFSIPSGWTLTNRDDGNNAFTDTNTYYYIRIQRTAAALVTKPSIVRIYIGNAINEYYKSPRIYGAHVSELKKMKRISYYFSPVAKYSISLKDRKDADLDFIQRGTIPMHNVSDNFLGGNFILNDNKLGSRKLFCEYSFDPGQIDNSYQYMLSSGSAVNLPWKLSKMEIAGVSLGVGGSSNRLR